MVQVVTGQTHRSLSPACLQWSPVRGRSSRVGLLSAGVETLEGRVKGLPPPSICCGCESAASTGTITSSCIIDSVGEQLSLSAAGFHSPQEYWMRHSIQPTRPSCLHWKRRGISLNWPLDLDTLPKAKSSKCDGT